MRPAWTCLIGILLAVALNRCTEYWTGTEFEPVKSLAKSCHRHATNIIQGLAVGYESSVWAVIIIAAAIPQCAHLWRDGQSDLRRLRRRDVRHRHADAEGNTISMDVFGPVADNANGIASWAYNKDTDNRDLQPGDPGYMRARGIQSRSPDLGGPRRGRQHDQGDHQGRGHSVRRHAAVSLFASFIAVIARLRGQDQTS